MYRNESELSYGWSRMDKVLPEILVIIAFWVATLFLPAELRSAGIEVSWLATALASGWACWKAGFISIALVMMGILAMAFGRGYGYVFFALAVLAGVGTAISVYLRRRRAQARSNAELLARARLRRQRDEELAAGASLRSSQTRGASPGVRSAPTASFPSASSRAAPSAPAASGGPVGGSSDPHLGAPFLLGACGSPSVVSHICDSAPVSYSCDAASDGGGGSCGD